MDSSSITIAILLVNELVICKLIHIKKLIHIRIHSVINQEQRQNKFQTFVKILSMEIYVKWSLFTKFPLWFGHKLHLLNYICLSKISTWTIGYLQYSWPCVFPWWLMGPFALSGGNVWSYTDRTRRWFACRVFGNRETIVYKFRVTFQVNVQSLIIFDEIQVYLVYLS